jgi:hypothetical protein
MKHGYYKRRDIVDNGRWPFYNKKFKNFFIEVDILAKNEGIFMYYSRPIKYCNYLVRELDGQLKEVREDDVYIEE